MVSNTNQHQPQETIGVVDMSLTQYFINQLNNKKIDPEGVALNFNDKTLSFGELNEKSDALANILKNKLNNSDFQNKNPDGDKIVLVCMKPSIELIITLFSISKAGAAYVPVEECFPDSRILHIINDCAPVFLITEESTKPRFEKLNLPCKIFAYQDLEQQECSAGVFCDLDVAQNEIAIVMYTSGSSGVPKGVRVSHRGVLNRLLWQWENFPYQSDEVCCMKTTFTFADSVPEIFGPLLLGVRLCIIQQNIVAQTDLFIETLEDFQITRIVLVPTLLRNILDCLILFNNKHLLRKIKLWVCSGETLDVELLRKFFKFFPTGTTICNFYGSTEVTFDATYEIFENSHDAETKIDSIGKVPIGNPIWNARIHLLDEDMKILPECIVGNIYVSGTLVAQGYVGGKMADKFIKEKIGDDLQEETLFRTGDLGSYLKSRDGKINLYFEGRNDSQIKVRGNRVDLKEIQLALNKMEGIRDSVILCYKQNTQDQVIVAFVITKATTQEIKEYLKHELQIYQMPEIFKIENKPLLVNGKTDRQKLLQIYEESKFENNEISWDLVDIPCEDKTLVEFILESICEVTNISGNELLSNMNQSFYSFGGTSQNTILVILKLREKGIHIAVKDFVRAKSIHHIVKLAKHNSQENKNNILTITHTTCSNNEYFFESLTNCHREAVIRMISYADAHKADLQVLLKITVKEAANWLETVYDSYVKGGLSFVVKRRSDGKIVGSAINKSYSDTAPLSEQFQPSKGFAYYFEFLWLVDQTQREKVLRMGKNIFRSGGVETCSTLSPGENVMITQCIEERNVELAIEHGFDGIVSTNINACTQQIARDILGYNVISDLQINQYKAPDGTRPFIMAKDTQRSLCCYKNLTN